jgi:putative endonuclease
MTIKAKVDGRGPLTDTLWHVYILKCSDGTNYVGKTKNLNDRLNRQATKQISYTSSRLPVELITWISFTDEWMGELRSPKLLSLEGAKAS